MPTTTDRREHNGKQDMRPGTGRAGVKEIVMKPDRTEVTSTSGLAVPAGEPARPTAAGPTAPPAVRALHERLAVTRGLDEGVAAIDELIVVEPSQPDQNWPDAATWSADGRHDTPPSTGGWGPSINDTLRSRTAAQEARDDLHDAAGDHRRPNGRRGYTWRRSDAWALDECRANAAVGDQHGGAVAIVALRAWQALSDEQRDAVSDGSL